MKNARGTMTITNAQMRLGGRVSPAALATIFVLSDLTWFASQLSMHLLGDFANEDASSLLFLVS